MEAKILVLCAMLTFVSAGPVRQSSGGGDSCAKTCNPSTKFSYQPGQTYIYDYTIETETSMDGASEEKALLNINGVADIEVIDQCDMVLKMRDVRVMESDPSQPGRLTVSRRSNEVSQLVSVPLRFSYQDGVVQDICPDSREDSWALNVKRGLLSALQNSMQSLSGSETVKEVDVTGWCDTKYSVSKNGYWGSDKLVKRSKDLLACTKRHGYMGALQTVRYQINSDMQAVPLTKSDQQCEQKITKGIVDRSTCTESHLFRPFSTASHGAKTTVQQTLKFRSSRNSISSRKDWIQARADLTFDHGNTMKDSSEARARTETLLNELCQMTTEGIQTDVPRVFSQLVDAVNKLDHSDIRQVYRYLKQQQICSTNNQRAQKFFLDALPMAGSSDSVEYMKELMLNDEVTSMEMDFWITSLAFITEPTPAMIDSVKDLVRSDKLQMKSMLAVSSMVYKLCQQQDCNNNMAVQDIMKSLKDTIGYRCSVNDGNINKVLTTLSAIGNSGQTSAIDILTRCLNNRLPYEVKVAAAQAYRKMPCDADKRQLMQLVRDTNEDSELRIAAYLPLMNCPKPELLNQVQQILQDEPENSQTGAYITSHLRNLKESSSPLKEDIKQMLEDVQVKKEFDLNPLKFSRNYEKSAFIKMINSGLQTEANMIFSDKSPMPRSINANLTMDVFGHSINLLEFGGRLEGIEYLIETLQANFFGNGKEKSSRKNIDELKGSAFARIFGNELAYGRFQGLQSLTSGKSFNLLDFLIKLSKDHDFQFTQSAQLLDSSITIPTVAGLPLTLSVNSTAVVDIKAKGKMDFRKISQSPRSVSVDGEIRPSGAVNIDGVMSVDGLVSRTGLKMSGSLHSSVSLKGRVELERGRILDVQLDMPQDRIDILDIRSKFFILHSKEEKEQKMITDNRKEFQGCSGKTLSKIFGVELCGELQFPNASYHKSGPYFPLTGPSSFSLIMHKTDSHTGYKLLAKRVEKKRSNIAQVSFDTPGSRVDRAMSVDMTINYDRKTADIAFASPWKKSNLKGSVINESGMKSVTGELVIDNDKTYSIKSEMKMDEDSKSETTTFSPLVELRYPGEEPIALTGAVQVETKGRRLSSDLTLTGASRKPINVQAEYVNNESEKKIGATYKYGQKTYSGEAGMSYAIRSGKSPAAQFNPLVYISTPEGDLFRMSGSTNYKQGKMLKSDLTIVADKWLSKDIFFKSAILKKASKKGVRYNVDLKFKSKPFTSNVNGYFNDNDGLKSSKITVDYNIFRVSRDVITLNGKLSDKSTKAFRKYKLTSAMSFKRNPEWNSQSSIDFDHKKKRTAGSVLVKYGKDLNDKNNQFALTGSLDRKIKDWKNVDFDYNIKALAPKLNIDTSLMGSHTHSPDFVATKMAVDHDRQNKFNVQMNLKDKSDKQLRVLGDFSLQYPGVKFNMDSAVKRNGKQYVHTLNMKNHRGPLVVMANTYKNDRDDTHEITSDINLDGQKPLKLSGKAGLDLTNLLLQGQVLHGKDSYDLNALSKISRDNRARVVLEMSHPERSVGLTANSRLGKNDADLDLEAAWDKKRDEDAKVKLSINAERNPEQTSSKAKVDFTSPFNPIKKVSASTSFDNDYQRYGLDGKLTFGKRDTYYTSVNAMKPISANNLEISASAGSPHYNYRKMEASLSHKMDDRSLSSMVKASSNRNNQVELSVQGKNQGWKTNDWTGSVNLKSPIRNYEDVSVTLAHKDDGLKYETRGTLQKNNDKYSADVDVSHFRQGWKVQHNGQLKISCPTNDFTTTWQHRCSNNNIKSSLKSNWGQGKSLQLDFVGDNRDKLHGNFQMTSPWEQVRDLNMILNHEQGNYHQNFDSAIVHNGEKKFAVDTKYKHYQGDFNGDFSLIAPLMDNKMSGSASAKYNSYPMTSHVELQFAPRHVLTGDVEFSKTSDNEMSASARISTPYRALRTISLTGSTKKEGRDVLAKANLDYGVRQNYDAEIRVRPDSLNLARVKITTPLENFSSLNAGYEVSGNVQNIDGTADFALEPLVGKYSSSLNWRLNDDMLAKLRINTPIRNMRYMQLTANSQRADQGRKSRIEFEHDPRQVYALTSFYTQTMPIIFSLDAETPISGLENMGMSLRHQSGYRYINSNAEIHYPADKKIEGSVALSWDRNVDGNLVLKTPFYKFEESKLSVRHDGEWDDFTTHGEVQMMRENMVADAQFKQTYNSNNGKFSLSSSKFSNPINAEFNHKGDQDNFKADASLAYGNEKFEGEVQHKLRRNSVKSMIQLKSPYNRNIKTSIDLSNRRGVMEGTVMGQIGNKQVEAKGTMQNDSPNFSATSTISHNLEGRTKEMTATMAKKGEWDNVDVQITLNTPFTEEIKLALQNKADLPRSLDTNFSASYGQNYLINSDNKLENRFNSFTATSDNNYKMAGPKRQAFVTMSKAGDLQDMTVTATAKTESKEIQMSGNLQTRNGLKTNWKISTPFRNFERLSMDFNHEPNRSGFRQSSSLDYMAGKKIEQSLMYQNDESNLNIIGSITSPIPNFEKNLVEIKLDSNNYSNQCSGSMKVKSAFGKHEVNYKRSGDLNNLDVIADMNMNGQKANAHITRSPISNGYTHIIELNGWNKNWKSEVAYTKTDEKVSGKVSGSIDRSSASLQGEASMIGYNSNMDVKLDIMTPTYQYSPSISMKKSGPWNDMTAEVSGNSGSNKVSVSSEFKKQGNDVSGKMTLETPMRGYNKVGASFKHTGNLDQFSTEGFLNYKDGKTIAANARFLRYDWRRIEGSFKLQTPFEGLESTKASYSHSGTSDGFDCNGEFEYGNSKKFSTVIRASQSPKYDLSVTVKTPINGYEKMVAEAQLESMGYSHTASSSLKLGRGQLYALDGSLDMESVPMTASGKLVTPLRSLRNIEISGSHQGQWDNFVSSVMFNSPSTNEIKGDVNFRYYSLFDMNGAASLNSRLEGLEDLRMEMKTTDVGNSKTGLVNAKWAPGQQITFDGSFENRGENQFQSDISLSTPFEYLRTASIHAEHNKIYIKNAPKLEVTWNGNTLLDMEAEAMFGDYAKDLTIITREPYPTEFGAHWNKEKEGEYNGQLLLNWNRDENDQNVQIVTKAKDIKASYQRDLEYSIKLIHPSRTVSTGMTAMYKDAQVVSEGHLSWDDNVNSKVYYNLELNDKSQYYGKSYEGKVKVGGFDRALESKGSYSNGRQVSALDASFAWDADRDSSKQVGFNAKLTNGDKTKTDLTFRLPALDKEVHIDHEMSVNQGNTVWDGKTALSYSRDSRKTLTLASSLKDVSSSYTGGKNYTLAVSITHPYTETDVSLNSHIGQTNGRYSAGLDAVYLTSRRQTKNVVLRGEIDRLRRQIDLQMDSPMKKISMHGQIESEKPYIVSLTNTYDDKDVIKSQINYDSDSKTLLVSTNYDLDNPENRLVFQSGYFNDTVYKAELYRQRNYRKVSDSLLTFNLNNSNLLHTRLAWRPRSIKDLERFVESKTITYSDSVRRSMESATEAIGQELSAKYAAISGELYSELSPAVDLLQNELSRVERQMKRAQRSLTKMYRNNDFYYKDVSDYLLQIIYSMKDYSEAYKTSYINLVNNLREQLQQLKEFNIRGKYDQFIGQLSDKFIDQLLRSMQSYAELVKQLDDKVASMVQSGQVQWDSIKRHPKIQEIHQRAQLLGSDYKWLMGQMKKGIQQYSVPEQYTSAIYGAHNAISSGLTNIMRNPYIQKAQMASNEVYQQGVWAYNYWEVEKNARESMEKLIDLLRNMAEEKVEELTEKLNFLKKTKVTVYDPRQGEIQLEIFLPIPLKDLKSMPDLQQYVKAAQNIADQYTPDTSMVSSWYNNRTEPKQNSIMSELDAYQPSKSNYWPRYGNRNPRVRSF